MFESPFPFFIWFLNAAKIKRHTHRHKQSKMWTEMCDFCCMYSIVCGSTCIRDIICILWYQILTFYPPHWDQLGALFIGFDYPRSSCSGSLYSKPKEMQLEYRRVYIHWNGNLTPRWHTNPYLYVSILWEKLLFSFDIPLASLQDYFFVNAPVISELAQECSIYSM